MTSPARRQRTSGRVERRAYLTRTPLPEFDELIHQMGGLIRWAG
ncbi:MULTISPECIES: hypothetical protein [Streptomyces]|nr:hypothetical protein [Streptomyces sp. MCA2]